MYNHFKVFCVNNVDVGCWVAGGLVGVQNYWKASVRSGGWMHDQSLWKFMRTNIELGSIIFVRRSHGLFQFSRWRHQSWAVVPLDELKQPWGCSWTRTKNRRGKFPTKDQTFILRDQKKRGAQRLTKKRAHERKYIKEQDPKFLHFLETKKKIFWIIQTFHPHSFADVPGVPNYWL